MLGSSQIGECQARNKKTPPGSQSKTANGATRGNFTAEEQEDIHV